MPVDAVAGALLLGLAASPAGAASTRRGDRARGSLGAALLAAAGEIALVFTLLEPGGGAAASLPAAQAGALAALAAAAAAAASLALPGARASGARGIGAAFGRAAFAGGTGEARLAWRRAGARPSRLLDAADRLRIERAIYDAEAKSAAELAVRAVGRCDDYGAAAWRLACFGAALALAGSAAFAPGATRAALAAAAGGAAAGHALALSARVRRFAVSEARLAERAAERAFDAFAHAGLARAPSGGGILLFAALFEGRALVLAGEGLAGAAETGELSDAAAALAAGLAASAAAEGLLEAIERVGALAARRLPPPRSATRTPEERPVPVRVED
jgi:uncharacterized membrane protein